MESLITNYTQDSKSITQLLHSTFIGNNGISDLSLQKSFTNFVQKIADSSKCVLRNLLTPIRSDCRSTTGCNLRIVLLVNKTNQDVVTRKDVDAQIYVNTAINGKSTSRKKFRKLRTKGGNANP